MFFRLLPLVLIPFAAAVAVASPGHSDKTGDDSNQVYPGVPAQASEADRQIQVEASDRMQFDADDWTFKAGETVEFVVHNNGRIPHEFVIDTKAGNAQHREAMSDAMANGGMMRHKDPNAVSVEPGETRSIAWTFTESGTFEAACNLPGHYQAGMHSRLRVTGTN